MGHGWRHNIRNRMGRLEMIDTLKTSAVGVMGSTTAQMKHRTEWDPPGFSSAAAFATLVYMLIKIYKET